MPNDNSKNQPSAPAPTESESLDDSLEPTAGSENNTAAAQSADTPPPTPKPSGLKALPLKNNLYLAIFVMMVIVGGIVVFISMKSAKPQTTTTKATSLTDQQISSIKGNTTLVGDSKQTLDVQSNSIFEGQVLARADLNVAGSLKVGGPLSLPSVSVGGTGTFGQIGVSGGLNVSGDTTLQGALTVQKNITVTGSATFGSLNVSTLGVTTLQLRGDINLNQHLTTSGGIPNHSNGTALGSGGTASVSGSDTAGTVNVSTGSNPPAGCFITINFVKGFSSTPHVVISPSNSSAGSLQYYTNRTASNFSICTDNVPAGGTNYVFDYVVIN